VRPRAFVRTAVLRRNLDASWPLIHPALKQGMSLKEWRPGRFRDPLPGPRILDWNVDWAYEDDVAADVVLQPSRRAVSTGRRSRSSSSGSGMPAEPVARLLMGAERRFRRP
jgi:hypothetical protein